MRREGHIIEEIVAYPNMSQSFDQVLRGTARKRSRQGRWLLAHREEVIAELSEKIADGSYFIEGGYRERTIIEGGKERRIQILTMKDRIACHAIMTVVDEHLKRRFICTTGASLPVTFKLGPDDAPCYRTFADVESLTQFYTQAMQHVQNALQEGWKAKENIDLELYRVN